MGEGNAGGGTEDRARRDADALLADAVRHFRANHPREAERACRAVLERAPERVDARHLLAVILGRTGRFDEAQATLEGALARDPRAPPLHMALGGLLLARGRDEQAMAAFERAVALDPGSSAARTELGHALRRLGRLAEAERALEAAIARDPDNTTAHLRLGNLRADQGRLAEAEAAVRAAIARAPGSAEAHVNLGNLLLAQLRLEEAALAYEKAIAIRPDLAQAHNNLGNARRDQGRREEAVAAYQRALALDPNLAETHYNLANTLQELGRDEDAAAAYRRALDCAPSYAKPHYGLAHLAMSKGDAAAALAACADCLALDPGNRYALAIEAAALDASGEHDRARTLVGLDRLVRPTRIEAPEGFADLAAFNEALARHVLDHPTLVHEPLNKATRGGRQTRELLVEPKGPVAALEAAIDRAIAAYRSALAPDAAHPFLAHRPARWRLNVWGTVLAAQGHQAAHIHPAGWLSGVYYVRLPAVVAANDAGHAGWIAFGGHDPAYGLDPVSEIRRIRPEEGLMVLFPSYVYHRTVPFEGDELRISIAFDALPLD